MGINLKIPLEGREKDTDSDYFKEWKDIFNNTYNAERLIFSNIDYYGYGGWLCVDILLRDGRVLSYEYGFDSCCDRLECACSTEIEDDIENHATFFDNMDQYVEWVNTLPGDYYGPDDRVLNLNNKGEKSCKK